jgi:tetratricopeptide (TPR) repeat protein
LLGDYLAKLKRKEEALKCYRIAGGLTKDPKFAIKLEKKVYKLERGSQKTRSIAKNQVSGKKQKTLQWGRSALIPDLGEVERKGLREARHDLDKVSERIFKQGKFFQKRGEWQKALLRFEDVYGLVKRDRKRFAKAWLLMEMGRCHEALGEYSEAYDKLNDSLRGFKRFKQKYPKALVLAELAKVNSALGRNDRARRYSRLSGRLAPDRRPSGKRSNPPRKFVRANALASLGPRSVGAAPGLGMDSGARRGSPVIRRAGKSPESTKMKALLKEIKKLRQKKDYEKLSNSLMELGDLYLKKGDRENAHRSLNAALAFKLKMGRKDELTKLLMKRAALRARIGQRVSALEDYVWAGISAEMAKQEENAKKSMSKAEKLAKELTKQSEKLLNSLKELWSKRLKGSVPNEAPLLYRVGKIYQAAGKNIAAGLYFERSTAASLVEKAITDHGQRSSGKFKRGVKMLESLDYYKYLQVKDRKRYSKRNISRL